MKKCITCDKELSGRFRKFCSLKCKNKFYNSSLQSYEEQKRRGFCSKKEAVMLLGGKCSRCGYDENLSDIEFHHIDPSLKRFTVDIRNFANRPKASVEEAKKCKLLCANCHRATHNPSLDNWKSIDSNNGSFVRHVRQN